MSQQPLAHVGFSCGRCYLQVGGIIVAMEGDKCRDGDLPEEILPEIPEAELERATIGGEPAKDIDRDIVRFFRGDVWNQKMLRYAAEKINQAAAK